VSKKTLTVLWLLATLGCGSEDEGSESKPEPAGVIAILGSSTAAGIGPTSLENSWVNRYAAFLADSHPKLSVENFAVGGYTTYQVQPDDFVPPQGRPPPALGHNITAALAIDPVALIVNLPSNDQAFGYTTAEQMENYGRVAELCAGQNLPLWVTTSQPRNFPTQAQRDQLTEARDAIVAQFGNHTLDFWTPTASADGTIQPQLDSGDGIHLNDDGHALLFDVVVAAKLPEALD
jgi:lysophospholipase L1-like esterase